MFISQKRLKKLRKIGLKCTKIPLAFLDLGLGFGGSHHSNPIFMPFPKWYNTYSPHLTWRLSLFFRRVLEALLIKSPFLIKTGIQGDPNQNLLFQMAVAQKLYFSDPML